MTASKRPRKRQLVPEFRQDALVDFFLVRPSATYQEAAEHFGVSTTWLRAVTSSDLFKARLQEQRKKVREHIVSTTSEQISGTIHTVVDRLAEISETTRDPATLCEILAALSKVTAEFGGPKKPTTGVEVQQQNNVFMASPEAIMAARETLQRLRGGSLSSEQPNAVLEGTVETANEE